MNAETKLSARHSCARGNAASGILLVLLLASIAYGTYRLFAIAPSETSRRAQVIAQLALARDALIGYSATDLKRPGRLPCPDIAGNGISPLLAGNDCPGYNGLLPWKTLDLAGDGDDRGQAIRYVVSPLFGGERNSPPLNSETAASLYLDPSSGASRGVAALLIAPRGPVDPRNNDGDELFFNGWSGAEGDNDVAVAITREELMAAAEQRIANQLRSCLAAHVSSSANTEQSYPWPAPLAKTDFQGYSGSLFGRFPDTQPGNPEAALQSGIGSLSASRSLLENSTSTLERIQRLEELQQQAGFLRGLFDRLYSTAVRIDTLARQAGTAMAGLDTRLATNPDSADTVGAIGTAQAALAALTAGLEDSGIDCFEQELATLNGKLRTDIDKASAAPGSTTLGNLLTSINNLKSPLLGNTRTPNADLQREIDDNRLLASEAALAVSDVRSKPAQSAAAVALAQALFEANVGLQEEIRGWRINLDPNELRYRARRIAELSAAPTANTNASSNTDLAQLLAATSLLLGQAPTGFAPLLAARTTIAGAMSAIDAASPTTSAACTEAASRLAGLATSLESTGSNLALETLKLVDSVLLTAGRAAALGPDEAGALRTSLAMSVYWGQVATVQAGELARLSRKSIPAKNDSETSAYTAARRLLDSLDGSSGTLSLYGKLNSLPTALNRENAEKAFAASLARLGELIDAANRLDGALSSGQARAAVPTRWFGSACEFLQAGNATSSWWFTQNWKNLFFYQISDRRSPDAGRLSVNGKGPFPVVVLAAGQPLPGRQDRTLPATSQYLEGRNSHPSRDGLALEPIRDFAKMPLAQDFNDQLAY